MTNPSDNSQSSDNSQVDAQINAQIDKNGWLETARCVLSPNYNNRPESKEINLLVIHNISLPPGEFGGPYIEDFFQNRLQAEQHPYFAQIGELQVSSHLFIRRDGECIQFVPFLKRAWHAGVSEFERRDNCNDYSIGIELEGADNVPYTQEQYATLTAVTRVLCNYFPDITKQRIVGHEHIAPGRKTDPGPMFDWDKYLRSL